MSKVDTAKEYAHDVAMGAAVGAASVVVGGAIAGGVSILIPTLGVVSVAGAGGSAGGVTLVYGMNEIKRSVRHDNAALGGGYSWLRFSCGCFLGCNRA